MRREPPRAHWRRSGFRTVLILPVLVAAAGGGGYCPTSIAPASIPHPGLSARPISAVGHDQSGHEDSEGLKLTPASGETVGPSSRCRVGQIVRYYDVVALNVDITLNRYLDHDTKGRMYALRSDVARVRNEEARNAAARAGRGDPAISLGLQGDAIQPLTLRARPGECLRIRFTNEIPGAPASIHLHGSSWTLAANGRPAVASESGALAKSGGSVGYEWRIPEDEPEGTHYFHSHGPDERALTNHGLFGNLIVEPPGSTWLDPRTERPTETGWDAIVQTQTGANFREFVLDYHEIGNENEFITDGSGGLVPQVDPITHAYRPDGRALNYRSEPFLNRLRLGLAATGRIDESLEYSSYAYGDPATPTMRSYLGDPVKQRVVHAGSEVFHVHHVHGGSIRWRRQPGVEPTNLAAGLQKHPPLVPQRSERTDSQSLGPSETFDVTDECGSGGCQQSTGDFLYHCHIAQHYFSGMWGVWRVYNTLQDGVASTDLMPPLQRLPDQQQSVRPAVPSNGLTPAQQEAIDRQLPPPGVPNDDDASVLDWTVAAGVYLGEPDDTRSWVAYHSSNAAQRRPLLFDPTTGRLAYPFLHPHLAKRPPFAPNHGPAPFLDPTPTGGDLPPPGASGPTSLCPTGTRPRQFAINAISTAVTLNSKDNLVDPTGELYVLRSQEDAARRDPRLQVPLALRANAGEDCVDVLLRNELPDTADVSFSKVGLHVHFVQFDVQASDGVDTGFNYEQTVRPFRAEGETLASATPAGANQVDVGHAARFHVGTLVGVGADQDKSFEAARIVAINGSRLTLSTPLRNSHDAGEVVSVEFVRYRWYPDAQFGTSYFHDHVNALTTWQHGLFGALVAEPPGATWTDPQTGAPLDSGAIADIHTTEPVGTDLKGSFRELALFTQDGNPITHVGRSSGSSFNLRAEPLGPDARTGDPSLLFSSHQHGDPATPMLQAYVGDPIVVRSLVGATNDIHTIHVDGHWFRAEPFSRTSPPIDTIRIGISERFDLVIPNAGGPQRMAGDYLYYNGRNLKLAEGSWGIVRVLEHSPGGLLKTLPGHEHPPPSATALCPSTAPVRHYSVSAVDVPLPMLTGSDGKAYVLARDEAALRAGSKKPEPLVLHVSVGDCIKVDLTNHTTGGPVSYHCDLLAYDPSDSGGIAAGNDPAQSVPPGGHRTYTYYASPEVGETVSLGRDWGDVLHNPGLGLYGAIVIGPPGARYRDPGTGGDVTDGSAAAVDVLPAAGAPYRDFSLFFQDQDEAIGSHRMPYTTKVDGPVAVNYSASPLDGAGVGTITPATPVLRARAGDPVRLHVLSPWSEQVQVFSLEGHQWSLEPGEPGTNRVFSIGLGPLESTTISLRGGAGGIDAIPGDYVYGDHRLPYQEAGLWGVLRVVPRSAPAAGLTRLNRPSESSSTEAVVAASAAALILALAAVYRIRRRPRRTTRRRWSVGADRPRRATSAD